MAKTKVKGTYEDLIKLAKEYGVEENRLFLSAAETYSLQMDIIREMKKEIENSSMTCEKTYLAGEKNSYANPIIKELPRHTDSANKTLLTMLDIINKLGRKQEKESALSAFDKEFS